MMATRKTVFNVLEVGPNLRRFVAVEETLQAAEDAAERLRKTDRQVEYIVETDEILVRAEEPPA